MQKNSNLRAAAGSDWTGKMGAPDTHAWLVRGQSRNVQEKSARAQQRRSDRTLHAHPEKRFCMHTEKKGFCARAASGSDRTGALTDAVERQQKKEKKTLSARQGK
jgi:hypothetical protein